MRCMSLGVVHASSVEGDFDLVRDGDRPLGTDRARFVTTIVPRQSSRSLGH